jgi:hypothetical protein
LYNVGQEYDCTHNDYNTDFDAKDERCSAKAWGGDRVTHEQYKELRTAELEEEPSEKNQQQESIEEQFLEE